MPTTTNKATVLGEYGWLGGEKVYTVAITRRGTAREVRRLWRELDSADGPETEEILRKLAALGALIEE